MDGLGWAWMVCSCRFTWFGGVGGVILRVENYIGWGAWGDNLMVWVGFGGLVVVDLHGLVVVVA